MSNTSWSLLLHYLKPHRWPLIGLWFLLLGSLAAQLLNPQIIRRFLDAAEMGQALTVLLGAAGLFFLIALIEQILGLFSTYISNNVAWLATNQLREDVLGHCLSLDLVFHKSHSPGEMIERIDGDINQLGNFFSRLALNLLNNLLLLIAVLLFLWWESAVIGAAVSLIALGGLLGVNLIRARAIPYWQDVRQATAEVYAFLEERLAGTEDIQANGLSAYAMRGLLIALRRVFEKSYRPNLFNMGGLAIPILVFGLAYSAVFILGDWAYRQQTMSVGRVYVLVYYLGLLSGPLWQIVNEIT